MRHRLRTTAGSADVNMTPMLDVVFILLIFFIVTATFVQEDGLQLVTPRNPQTPPSELPMAVLVQIDANNSVFVNGRLTDPARVTALIERLNVDNSGRTTVAVQPHPDAEHGVVTRTYDAALAANVLGVALRPPEREFD